MMEGAEVSMKQVLVPVDRPIRSGRVVLASALLLVGLVAPARGQGVCYTGPTSIYDLCGTATFNQPYELKPAKSSYFVAEDRPYLVLCGSNDLTVFDATNPASPVSLVSAHIPWDWTNINVSGSTHEPYITHISNIATLDGFPYALAMLGPYGWDFLHLNGAASGFLGHGYRPDTKLPGSGYTAAALFQAGTTIYAVGQMLDQKSIDSGDISLRIYAIGGRSPLGGTIDTASLTPATIGPGVRVPVGSATDAPGFTGTEFPVSGGLWVGVMNDLSGTPILIARTASTSSGLVVDISSPNAPNPLAVLTNKTLMGGTWALDPKRSALWVGSWASTLVNGYVLDARLLPQVLPPQYPSVNYNPAGPPLTGQTSTMSVAGDLLVASGSGVVGYLSLGGSGQPQLLPALVPFTGLSGRVCLNDGYVETYNNVKAFVVGGNYYVCRAMQVDADVVGVGGSCMATTPVPAFTVSGGEAAASCLLATGWTPDGRGFPGDTFTITDASGGQWTSATLDIQFQGQSIGGSFPTTITPRQVVTWATAAAMAPGDYSVVLGNFTPAATPDSKSKEIMLCAAPAAAAQVTGVQPGSTGNWNTTPPFTYLTGDNVQVSALAPTISQGNPTVYTWSVQDAMTQTWGTAQNGPSINVPLPQPGTYQAFVAVQYGFPGVPDPTTCAGAPATVTLSTTNYTSCAAVPLPSNPFSVSQITVSDGTTTATAATNLNPPTLLRGNPITFSATYRVAGTYTPAFVWGFNGASTPPAPSADLTTTPGTVKGVIPANTLSVSTGNNAEFLQAIATPVGGGQAVDLTGNGGTVLFNVTDCVTPGQATNTAPGNGAQNVTAGTVTFSWTGPSTGTGPFTYKVKPSPNPFNMTLCSSVAPTTSCTYPVSAGTTLTWQVITNNSCGSATSASTPTSFTTASPPPTPTPTPTPPPSGNLSLRASPNPATAGQNVTFSFSPSLSLSGDSLTVYFGDGQSQTVSYPCLVCNVASHTYSNTNTQAFTVSASGIAGGASVSGSTSVTVQVVCTAPAAPTASFTYSPAQVRAGQPVQFVDTSGGLPSSWSWTFGDGAPPLIPGHSSSQQNPTNTFASVGTYTIALTVTNCKGSSATSQQITVVSSCDQTVVPTASFTWPTGAVDGFPEQQQPYAGQAVTLTDTSTNSPISWAWAFGDGGTSSQQNPAHAYAAAQTYTVKLTATNCVDPSAEVAQPVTIYPDVRHVNADFTWGSDPLTVGAPVTLTANTGPSYGDPDTFTWTFDDGTAPQSGALASIPHTFTCAGPHTVTLTASRSNDAAATAAATHTLTVTGQPQCAPLAVMTVNAASTPGQNATFWRTDVRIFNPSAQSSKVTVEFVPVNAGSKSGPGESTTLAPNATWVLDDILGTALTQGFVGAGVTKAALRFTSDNTVPIVVSDTFTPAPSGSGQYGQATPGIEVVPTTTPPVLWIAGIRNNGITMGFRTNYSLVNLRSDVGVQNLTFTLFDQTGTAVATQTTSMNTLEYRQDSLANLFGGAPAAVSPDPLAVRVEVPTGSDVQAYVSVMDNLTGDPVLIPAVPPPTSPIFLPAVGHTPGLNGTVWRADLQITNPDGAAPHTWEIKYLPRSGTGAFRSVTLAPQATMRMDDLLSWVFNGLLSADASTSGVVRIAPADGSLVYPIVQARSFNQTPNGTFGQNITPITGNMGVAAGQGERLVLTGMSSQDIARTNLGFVNLSDTSSVVFSVIFYDEGGNVLNPLDGQSNPIPYTISLGVGGWDQDLLENRFKNTAGWPALGVNLKAISAVIQVTGGGPGTAYATVIDSQTGDPNFILAQPAP